MARLGRLINRQRGQIRAAQEVEARLRGEGVRQRGVVRTMHRERERLLGVIEELRGLMRVGEVDAELAEWEHEGERRTWAEEREQSLRAGGLGPDVIGLGSDVIVDGEVFVFGNDFGSDDDGNSDVDGQPGDDGQPGYDILDDFQPEEGRLAQYSDSDSRANSDSGSDSDTDADAAVADANSAQGGGRGQGQYDIARQMYADTATAAHNMMFTHHKTVDTLAIREDHTRPHPLPQLINCKKTTPRDLWELLVLPTALPGADVINDLLCAFKLPNCQAINTSIVDCGSQETSLGRGSAKGAKAGVWRPTPSDWLARYLHQMNIFTEYLCDPASEMKFKSMGRWAAPVLLIDNARLGLGLPAGSTPLNFSVIKSVSWRVRDLMHGTGRESDTRRPPPAGSLGLSWGVMLLLPAFTTIKEISATTWNRLIESCPGDPRWPQLVALCLWLSAVWEHWAAGSGMDPAKFRDAGAVQAYGLKLDFAGLQKAFVEFLA